MTDDRGRERERERKWGKVCVLARVCVCEVNLWSWVTALPFLATDRAQLVQLASLTALFLQQCVVHSAPSSRLLTGSALLNQSTQRRPKRTFNNKSKSAPRALITPCMCHVIQKYYLMLRLLLKIYLQRRRLSWKYNVSVWKPGHSWLLCCFCCFF